MTQVTDPSAFKEGSLGIQVVLFIVTGGLYGIWWIHQTHSQLAAGTDADFTPVTRTLLIVIGGMFLIGLYWLYLTCKDAEAVTDKSGGLLFVLFLVPFGGILSWYWIQSGINQTAASA